MMPRNHMQNSQQSTFFSGLTATTTPNYFHSEANNIFTLNLQSSQKGTQITLSPGDQIVFMDLPATWQLSSKEAGWVLSSFSYRGSSYPCLQYQETGKLEIPLLTEGKDQAIDALASPLGISMEMHIPATTAAQTTLHIELFDSSGQSISNSAPFLCSFISAQAPLISYTAGSAAVLLSGVNDYQFPNQLSCILFNQTNTAIASASLVLKLKAYDTDGNTVSISQETANVSVSGGNLDWQQQAIDGDFQYVPTTPLQLSSLSQAEITVSGLQLSQPQIARVELEFTVTGITGQQGYVTSAWYLAYGPYTLSLAFDAESSQASSYCFFSVPSGAFQANSMNAEQNMPPLIPLLLDNTGSPAYPPVSGGFSWSDDALNYTIDNPLTPDAPNTLYYVVNICDTYACLTRCVINMNIITQNSTGPLAFTTQLPDGTYFGMSLQQQDFSSWQNLNGADFTGADLTGANFTASNMTGATLSQATMTGAILDAVSSGQIISEGTVWPDGCTAIDGYILAPKVNLTAMNFTNQNLSNLDLNGANFTNCVLTGTNLSGANFTNAILSNVTSGGISASTSPNLPTNFVLQAGYLLGPGVNLAGADLSRQSINSQVSLAGANLQNANLTGFSISITGILDLSHADFSGANLTECSFMGEDNHSPAQNHMSVDLSFANFTNTTFGLTLIGGTALAIIIGGVQNDLSQVQCLFAETNLTSATFSNIKAGQPGCIWGFLYNQLNQTSFSKCNLELMAFACTDLTGACFTETVLKYAALDAPDNSSLAKTLSLMKKFPGKGISNILINSLFRYSKSMPGFINAIKYKISRSLFENIFVKAKTEEEKKIARLTHLAFFYAKYPLLSDITSPTCVQDADFGLSIFENINSQDLAGTPQSSPFGWTFSNGQFNQLLNTTQVADSTRLPD